MPNCKKKPDYSGIGLDATVEGMLSDDYRERFKAEYQQTWVRYRKLDDMLAKYESDALEFEPKSGYFLLKGQLKAMDQYLFFLEARAEAEGIEL